MTYEQAISYIHSFMKFGIRPGLERVAALLSLLGSPQDRLKFVHVAGTNGKGSTSEMLSEILQCGGYKTGLFTSPYVVDFRERMQINSELIGKDELTKHVEKIVPLIEKLKKSGIEPTEFEVVTAVALDWFAEQSCDAVVLEVGLGGRFDATNIIGTPLVSVITSISLDHMKILGGTIEKIAFEKCGIIKKNGVTVTYPEQKPEALAVIMECAARENNRLIMGNINSVRTEDESISGTDIVYDGLSIHIPLAGRHQTTNAVTAIEAAKALDSRGLHITNQNIADGIENAKMPARMEVLCKNPLVIIDGAHNPSGAEALSACIESCLSDYKIIAVMGVMADKDYNKMVKFIAPHCDAMITTTPSNPRALHADVLLKIARMFCSDSRASENPVSAFDEAFNRTEGKTALLVCGSLYLAEDIRQHAMEEIKNRVKKA